MPGQFPPPEPPAGAPPPKTLGASHSAEIQYAMGNLDLDPRYAWGPDDYEASATMQEYFASFARTGDPNGPGLPKWPTYDAKTGYRRMHAFDAIELDVGGWCSKAKRRSSAISSAMTSYDHARVSTSAGEAS